MCLLDLVSVAGVSTENAVDRVQIPKGEMWSVHKFGGTCVGNSQRIRNVAEVIINDNSERKLVVVSAMSKVTDMMYDLIRKAQSRDDSYLSALEAVLEKHRLTARDLLDGDDLASFLSHLHDDISNLTAMLRAIYIGTNRFGFHFLDVLVYVLFFSFCLKSELTSFSFCSGPCVRVVFRLCCRTWGALVCSDAIICCQKGLNYSYCMIND